MGGGGSLQAAVLSLVSGSVEEPGISDCNHGDVKSEMYIHPYHFH